MFCFVFGFFEKRKKKRMTSLLSGTEIWNKHAFIFLLCCSVEVSRFLMFTSEIHLHCRCTIFIKLKYQSWLPQNTFVTFSGSLIYGNVFRKPSNLCFFPLWLEYFRDLPEQLLYMINSIQNFIICSVAVVAFSYLCFISICPISCTFVGILMGKRDFIGFSMSSFKNFSDC